VALDIYGKILSTNRETRPDAHPLDYDWRFSAKTVEKLEFLIRNNSSLLLVGTPSIASHLNSKKTIERPKYELIDRQQICNISNQLNIDVGTASPLTEYFELALLDAPWYLEEIKRWLSWTSQNVICNGLIISSIWPKDTRPNAQLEREELFNWLRNWSHFSIKESFLDYEQPHFEKVAKENNPFFNQEKKWIKGDLLIIWPFRKLPLLPKMTRENTWVRYTINNLQLAVKLDKKVTSPKIGRIVNNSWIWPHISMRAEGRAEIGFWSSDNFVAKLDGSKLFITLLENYLGLDTNLDPAIDNSCLDWYWSFFKSWNIPENCAEKVTKWTHQE
jgi:hypothetical protein